MKFFFTISFLIIIVSCRKAVITPDTAFPDLPAYSEKGLNTGGTLINNKAWITHPLAFLSTVRPVQLFSYPAGDSVVILINGNYKDATLPDQNPNTIFIVLKNIHISTDAELLQMNGKTYLLDGTTNYGGISDSYGYNKTGHGSGSIRFGKVSEISNVTVGDGSPGNPVLHPYIISGQFDMTMSSPVNYSFTHGRFDVNLIRSSNQFVIF
ncbi:MAG: hypothetical protein IPP73_11790 [Chitinophagaceae bacterium]|nr:hypothetical protein [Chitinophagaceae bacterium]